MVRGPKTKSRSKVDPPKSAAPAKPDVKAQSAKPAQLKEAPPAKAPVKERKGNLILGVIVAALIIFAIAGFLLYKPKLQGMEKAQEHADFLGNIRINTDDGEFFAFMDCDGAVRRISQNQYSPAVWQMLALAGLYESTSDERYVAPIRSIESRLPALFLETDGNPYQAAVMGKQLVKSYEMLKGKGVLQDEEAFKALIVDSVSFLNDIPHYDWGPAQSNAMLSGAISAALPYLKKDDAYLSNARELALQSRRQADEQGKELCWALLSEYEYNKAAGKDNAAVVAQAMAFEPQVTPNEIQPCVDLLYQAYLYDHDAASLKQAVSLLGKLESQENRCEGRTEGGLSTPDVGGTKFYISDNAWQVYLLTRQGISDEVFAR